MLILQFPNGTISYTGARPSEMLKNSLSYNRNESKDLCQGALKYWAQNTIWFYQKLMC